jgi:galactokinase
VVDENNRLLQACEDLKKGDIHSLGQKMFETHDGLSKQYEVSCTELDFLVDQVRDHKAVLGARMMGGGFGGCTINLVEEGAIEKLAADIKVAYDKATGLSLSHYVASVEDGTKIISSKTAADV